MKTKIPISFVLLCMLVLLAVGSMAFAVGVINGILSERHSVFNKERDVLESILTTNEDFGSLSISEYSGGGAVLVGDVPNKDSYDVLRLMVEKQFGEQRSSRVMAAVSIQNPKPS